MGRLPDLRPIFYLAVFGMIVAALCAFIGVPVVLWWLFHHVVFV